MLSAMPSRRHSSAIELCPPGRRAQSGSSLWPHGVSELPVGCCGQASRTSPGWSWISVSSSLLEGYDEPEILPSSSCQFCLTGAEAGQIRARKPGRIRRLLQPSWA
jgi:hypothetical protein